MVLVDFGNAYGVMIGTPFEALHECIITGFKNLKYSLDGEDCEAGFRPRPDGQRTDPARPPPPCPRARTGTRPVACSGGEATARPGRVASGPHGAPGGQAQLPGIARELADSWIRIVLFRYAIEFRVVPPRARG